MDIDWALLNRCLAGECTEDERAHFEAWLAASPVHRRVLQEMRDLTAQAGRDVPLARAAELLADLKRRLPGTDAGAGDVRPLRLVGRAAPGARLGSLRAPSRWVMVGRAAAVVALVLGGAAATDHFDQHSILAIHGRLMAHDQRKQIAGRFRTGQNWIGGNDYNPCGADFVPPPPEKLPDLLEDLCAAINRDLHPPIVQAALVHAQFETIHPFDDGTAAQAAHSFM